MKGRDGVAEHQSLTGVSALAAFTMLAAPGVGRQICVTKVCITSNATGGIILEDGAGVDAWQVYLSAGRPAVDLDLYGLFILPDNQSLELNNAPLGTVRWNLTYEIRPTGM